MPESIADEPYRAPVITGETVFEGTVWNINRDRFAFGGGELPAGLLDIAGEPPLDAAKRELAEEADLEADEWAVLAEFFSSPGGSSEAITIYRARGLRATKKRFGRTADEAEINMRWMPLSEVVAAVLDGRLRNSILAIAVLNAHARR